MQKEDALSHSDMGTFLVRTSSLILLLSLLTRQVTMVTTREDGLACRQVIQPELIRELWNCTRQLLEILPKEEKPSRHSRLLPKFCTKCSEGTVGWLEIRDMIDVYQWTVFSQEEVKKLLPLHFPELLFRLQSSLHNCVDNGKLSKWSKTIKKLERTIKKRNADGVLKAVSEFPFLLRWTGELVHHL